MNRVQVLVNDVGAEDDSCKRMRSLSFSAVDNLSAAPGISASLPLSSLTCTPSRDVCGKVPNPKDSSVGGYCKKDDFHQSGPAKSPFEFPAPIIPVPNYTWSSEKGSGALITATENVSNKLSNNTAGQKSEEEVDYLQLILNARVYDVAVESPLDLASNLSGKLGNAIYLKREDKQPIFSFKIRGAYNRMCQLSAEERGRGVIAVSAGNHAQGVALAAQKLGVKATIVMPTFAPEIKVANVRRLGGNVVLFGNCFDDAKKECQRQAELYNYTFIPPFDDPYIIAGQGTVGVEILRQLKSYERLDAIFVAVGGGGLLAGIAAFVKRVRPEVKLIGVNTVDSTSMTTSLQTGERTEMAEVGLFSDGTSVKLIGKENFRICQKYVDDMILVSNDEICAAIKDVYDDTRSILEPAGALSLAGCKRFLSQNPEIKDGVFVAVLSGANMNFSRLQFVAERARIGEGKEALFSVVIPEVPGSLFELYKCIYPRYVTELSYRYFKADKAHIYVGFEVHEGNDEKQLIIGSLAQKNMAAIDISDDEMAKSHGRFLAGGRSATVVNERLYRITFPERPGALYTFLEHVSNSPDTSNISLFHYRNHGADMARVLLGVQLNNQSNVDFYEKLLKLGYSVIDESNNQVYEHFLK